MMKLMKYFDINPPKTVSIAFAVNKLILHSILYNHNGIKDSNFQFPRDCCKKKVPCQKNNLSKKGNVENDISFPR